MSLTFRYQKSSHHIQPQNIAIMRVTLAALLSTLALLPQQTIAKHGCSPSTDGWGFVQRAPLSDYRKFLLQHRLSEYTLNTGRPYSISFGGAKVSISLLHRDVRKRFNRDIIYLGVFLYPWWERERRHVVSRYCRRTLLYSSRLLSQWFMVCF